MLGLKYDHMKPNLLAGKQKKKPMDKNLTKICYWCGIELTDETNKTEHVPPFGFFPKGYREQLITVSACEEHNTKFSLLDERFQVYIKAIGSNQIATDDFKDRVDIVPNLVEI